MLNKKGEKKNMSKKKYKYQAEEQKENTTPNTGEEEVDEEDDVDVETFDEDDIDVLDRKGRAVKKKKGKFAKKVSSMPTGVKVGAGVVAGAILTGVVMAIFGGGKNSANDEQYVDDDRTSPYALDDGSGSGSDDD